MKESELEVSKELHFSYRNIGNFSKLLCTLLYEKTHDKKQIALWHMRYDNDESDCLFENFLNELFPDGATLGEEELNKLTEYAEDFLEKDYLAMQQRVEWDKNHYISYVYSRVDNEVVPCDMGKHQGVVIEFCKKFFKGVEDIDKTKVANFIKSNFEIKSDYTSVESMVNDASYIVNRLILDR